MPFFVFIDPYRTRPGTGKTCSLHVTPPVEITPKILANFASLNSSIAFGDSASACGGRPRRHRRERKAPRAILELSDAKFARILWVILAYQIPYQNQTFIPQNLRVELELKPCFNFNVNFTLYDFNLKITVKFYGFFIFSDDGCGGVVETPWMSTYFVTVDYTALYYVRIVVIVVYSVWCKVLLFFLY